MVLFAGPAVLGGVLICVALAAWMVGRWQGGFVPPVGDRDESARPASPPLAQETQAAVQGSIPAKPLCQQAAQAERRGALEAAASLGDLHAEVSAYRRTQQVLSAMGPDQLDVVLIASDAGHACRYIGVSGRPTCPLHGSARQVSACGSGCAGFDPLQPRAVQPSPAVSGRTRV